MNKTNKGFLGFIKRCFSYKNNIFILILSLFVSLGTALGIGVINYNQEKNSYYYGDYPDNYSFCWNVDCKKSDLVESTFYGLDYTKVYTEKDDITITNLSGYFPKTHFRIYGVSENFYHYPLQSVDCDTNIRFSNLEKGTSFTKADIIQNNLSFMMYTSQAHLFSTKSSSLTITIKGQNFKLIGTLKDTADIDRTLNNDDINIHIFVPYSTLNYLFGLSRCYYSINNQGHTLKTTKDNVPYLANGMYNDYSYFKNSTSKLSLLFYEIDGLLIFLSFISVLIVGILNIKNRSNEIGVRRAVGATKDDISFMFLSEGTFLIGMSVILSFVLDVAIFGIMSTILSQYHFIYVFFFDWKSTVLALSIYYLAAIIGVLIPALIGSRTNISSILVEEH